MYDPPAAPWSGHFHDDSDRDMHCIYVGRLVVKMDIILPCLNLDLCLNEIAGREIKERYGESSFSWNRIKLER